MCVLTPATLLLATVLGLAAGAVPQAPPDKSSSTAVSLPTAYDAISIHLHPKADDGMSINRRDRNFEATNVSLEGLIENAFDIRQGQIRGLPGWAKKENWDVQAKLLDLTPDQRKALNAPHADDRSLIVALLKSRFALKFHWEMPELPTYDLVIAKGGQRFAENAAKNAAQIQSVGGHGVMTQFDKSKTLVVVGDSPLTLFVKWGLASELQRTVIDKTGLTGDYSFVLEYTKMADAAASNVNAQDDSGPSLFTAVKEQLGLQLVSSKGPVPVLVVDSVEPPAAN